MPEPDSAEPWPRGMGELDDLARACSQLSQSGRLDRHRAQTACRQLQAVLDHVPQGVAVTQGEHVELVSLQASRMLGYAPQQLRGRNLLDLLTAHAGGEGGESGEYDKGEVVRRVRSELATHGVFDGELPLQREDGSTLWLHVRGQWIQPGEPMRGMVWTLEDFTAERESRHQQAWARTRDPLTHLMNRAELVHRLQLLLAECAQRRPQRDACGVLLFMDLDHFTVVNDVAGRDAGDDVLRRLARLLESEVRHSGWAARLGGDEFAVLLPGSTLSRGQGVAEQLRAAVQAWEPAYQGRGFTLGLSIGLVPLLHGLHDAAALLYAADMACYEAKRAGRNQVSCAPASAQT